MVEDGFSHGRVSFYAAVSEESAECLEVIVHAFKEVNPTSDEIRVIVIDKDFTEYKVLTNTPRFYFVKEYFNKMVSECEVAKSNREELQKKLKDLVYAANESDYNQLKTKGFKLANTQFIKYFEKNWHNCQSMWVTYLRDEYLHLANTTNNRLECHHHRLKDLISQSCMLSEMFNHILTFPQPLRWNIHRNLLLRNLHPVQLNFCNF